LYHCDILILKQYVMMKPLCSMIGILIANSAFSQCPPTTPTITGASVLCNGASGSLSVSGSGDTYTWTPGGANTTSISISPTTTTTYSVLMGQTGCTLTSAAAITVTVANTPTVVAAIPIFTGTANSFTACGMGFQSPTFEASGASSYTWSTGATTATTSVYVPFTTSPPSYTNTYTVIGQNVCGTSTAAITTLIYSMPSLGISASHSLICIGSQVTVKATSWASIYEWKIAGSGPVIATTSSIVVSPTVTTNYDVTVTNGTCSRSDDITVTVNSCTGLAELSPEAGVKVYPNPVTELLYVDLYDRQGPGVLEVYDMTGKIKMKESVSGYGNVIPVGSLQSGLYFYKVSGKTGKFIKQ